MLIEECWKNNVLLLGISKDIVVHGFKNHVRPTQLSIRCMGVRAIVSILYVHHNIQKMHWVSLEWFVHMVDIGTYKIPEIQKQYAKIKEELEAIDYKKAMAKYELQNITNQIAILNRISYNKRNQIEYLKIEAQELEGYVHRLENHNQQQQHKIQNE